MNCRIIIIFCDQVNQPPVNEAEKTLLLKVKEKLTSFSMSPQICRSALVVQLRNELRDLRMELDSKKMGRYFIK